MTVRIESISFPETPPSYNKTRYLHWRASSKQKRYWEQLIGGYLMAYKTPRGLVRVEATARLRFLTKRKRDEGNFRVGLEKALGDALVAGRYIPDDTPEHYQFGAVTFEPLTGAERTCLTLRLFSDDSPSLLEAES